MAKAKNSPRCHEEEAPTKGIVGERRNTDGSGGKKKKKEKKEEKKEKSLGTD